MDDPTISPITRDEDGGWTWTVTDDLQGITRWRTDHNGQGLWQWAPDGTWTVETDGTHTTNHTWKQRLGHLQFDLDCSPSTRRRRVRTHFTATP